MAESGDRSSLLGAERGRGASSQPLYHDQSQTPTNKLMQLAFVTLVVLMLFITLILSIYRGVTAYKDGGIYIMLGLSLLGFVIVQIFMIIFVRNGDLPKEKSWFLYFVGGCVILEAIFTDILLFESK